MAGIAALRVDLMVADRDLSVEVDALHVAREAPLVPVPFDVDALFALPKGGQLLDTAERLGLVQRVLLRDLHVCPPKVEWVEIIPFITLATKRGGSLPRLTGFLQEPLLVERHGARPLTQES